MLRVLLVDDVFEARQLMRDQLRTWTTTVTVIGEAVDGADAIRQATTTQPDVIILDDEMPRLSGTQAVRWLRMVSPRSRVILHGSSSPPPRTGACAPDGFVEKGSPAQNLIREVGRGPLRCARRGP